MHKTKKNKVTPIIQAKLMAIKAAGFIPRIDSRLPETSPLVKFTIWVSGKTAIATP
jgi:hypothetical protein